MGHFRGTLQGNRGPVSRLGIKFIGEPPENVDAYLKQLYDLSTLALDAEDMFSLDELEKGKI